MLTPYGDWKNKNGFHSALSVRMTLEFLFSSFILASSLTSPYLNRYLSVRQSLCLCAVVMKGGGSCKQQDGIHLLLLNEENTPKLLSFWRLPLQYYSSASCAKELCLHSHFKKHTNPNTLCSCVLMQGNLNHSPVIQFCLLSRAANS